MGDLDPRLGALAATVGCVLMSVVFVVTLTVGESTRTLAVPFGVLAALFAGLAVHLWGGDGPRSGN